jgi:hypothetical protein
MIWKLRCVQVSNYVTVNCRLLLLLHSSCNYIVITHYMRFENPMKGCINLLKMKKCFKRAGNGEITICLKGSPASPARPSYKGSVRVMTLWLL